jgi:hypothetical protein
MLFGAYGESSFPSFERATQVNTLLQLPDPISFFLMQALMLSVKTHWLLGLLFL